MRRWGHHGAAYKLTEPDKGRRGNMKIETVGVFGGGVGFVEK